MNERVIKIRQPRLKQAATLLICAKEDIHVPVIVVVEDGGSVDPAPPCGVVAASARPVELQNARLSLRIKIL